MTGVSKSSRKGRAGRSALISKTLDKPSFLFKSAYHFTSKSEGRENIRKKGKGTPSPAAFPSEVSQHNIARSLSTDERLELFKRAYPRDALYKFSQGTTLASQRSNGGANRIIASRASWLISVRPMKSEIGLVKLSDRVTVFPENAAARLHIRLGLFDLPVN